MWAREQEFQQQLERVAKKPSKSGIQELASIALEDEKQCYKHVCALIVRQMKRSKAVLRLNLLYVVSAICRQSRAQLGSKDKYVPRLEPQLVTIATLLAEGPLDQKDSVSKVLRTWKKEQVFSVAVLREVDAVFGGQTEAMSSHIASQSPSGLPGASSSPMHATASAERHSTGFALSDPSSGSQPATAAAPVPLPHGPPTKYIKVTPFSGSNAPLSLSTGSSKPTASNEHYDAFAADSYAGSPGGDPVPVMRSPLPPQPSQLQQGSGLLGASDHGVQASRKRSRWDGPLNTGESTAVRSNVAGPAATAGTAESQSAPEAPGQLAAAALKLPVAPKSRLTWGAGLAAQGKTQRIVRQEPAGQPGSHSQAPQPPSQPIPPPPPPASQQPADQPAAPLPTPPPPQQQPDQPAPPPLPPLPRQSAQQPAAPLPPPLPPPPQQQMSSGDAALPPPPPMHAAHAAAPFPQRVPQQPAGASRSRLAHEHVSRHQGTPPAGEPGFAELMQQMREAAVQAGRNAASSRPAHVLPPASQPMHHNPLRQQHQLLGSPAAALQGSFLAASLPPPPPGQAQQSSRHHVQSASSHQQSVSGQNHQTHASPAVWQGDATAQHGQHRQQQPPPQPPLEMHTLGSPTGSWPGAMQHRTEWSAQPHMQHPGHAPAWHEQLHIPPPRPPPLPPAVPQPDLPVHRLGLTVTQHSPARSDRPALPTDSVADVPMDIDEDMSPGQESAPEAPPEDKGSDQAPPPPPPAPGTSPEPAVAASKPVRQAAAAPDVAPMGDDGFDVRVQLAAAVPQPLGSDSMCQVVVSSTTGKPGLDAYSATADVAQQPSAVIDTEAGSAAASRPVPAPRTPHNTLAPTPHPCVPSAGDSDAPSIPTNAAAAAATAAPHPALEAEPAPPPVPPATDCGGKLVEGLEVAVLPSGDSAQNNADASAGHVSAALSASAGMISIGATAGPIAGRGASGEHAPQSAAGTPDVSPATEPASNGQPSPAKPLSNGHGIALTEPEASASIPGNSVALPDIEPGPKGIAAVPAPHEPAEALKQQAQAAAMNSSAGAKPPILPLQPAANGHAEAHTQFLSPSWAATPVPQKPEAQLNGVNGSAAQLAARSVELPRVQAATLSHYTGRPGSGRYRGSYFHDHSDPVMQLDDTECVMEYFEMM